MDFPGNAFTQAFDLALPIVQGPMGGVAGPELVSAVANAGALGLLPIWSLSPEAAAHRIAQTRELTHGAFGVNLRADLDQSKHISAALDGGVSIIHLFWGDPHAAMRHTGMTNRADIRSLVTVRDADAAKAALDAGADALIAQGVEAGGHVLSEIPLDELLPTVLDLADPVPVIAAGGLADAQDVAHVVASGASGALLGTRFAATAESMAHIDYKLALIEAGQYSTVRSLCFNDGWENAPHRTLKNTTFDAWDEAHRPPQGSRPGEGDIVLNLGESSFARYSVMPPVQGMTGDIRSGAMYAGTGVWKIHDCPSVAEVIAELSSLLVAD